MTWKQYQEEAAQVFRNLGCSAEVDALVAGARGRHKVDVWVRFKKFGIETRWVIECKYWHSSVTKEKVLTLRSVVEDVGADRGILISTAGFQSGAVRATDKTNLTLTDLHGLRASAQEELLLCVLQRFETKAVALKHELFDLSRRTERPGPLGGTVMRAEFAYALGRLAFLSDGFDRIRLRKPPYPITVDQMSNSLVAVDTMDEFVARLADVLAEIEATIAAESG